jgi:hypothetical protein
MDNITFVPTFRMESYCHIDTSDVNKVIDFTIAIITRVEVFISSYFFQNLLLLYIYLYLLLHQKSHFIIYFFHRCSDLHQGHVRVIH